MVEIMKKGLRLGIIGCGDMAKVHVLALNEIKEAEITAVCDQSTEKRTKLKELVKGCQPEEYIDYRDLLKNSQIDAVLVALPNFLHREVGVAVLKNGRHLFMEKPLACNTPECDEILNLAEKKKLVLQVGFIYRYTPHYRKIAELLNKKEIGKPSLFWTYEYRPNFPHAWRYSQELSGGTLVEKCCHFFDLFNWWAAGPPKSLIAVGGQNVIKNGIPYHVYCPPTEEFAVSDSTIIDHAFVNIEYHNGIKANLALCLFIAWNGHEKDGCQVGIVTEMGKRIITNEKGLFLYGTKNGKEKLEIAQEKGKHFPVQEEDREFIDCILKDKKPFADGWVGREAVRIGENAEISIQRGGEKIWL
ncbi:MAG: Gfo/Idh/MocA family oxidoreductase [Candidatus Omnitrophota bacterium]